MWTRSRHFMDVMDGKSCSLRLISNLSTAFQFFFLVTGKPYNRMDADDPNRGRTPRGGDTKSRDRVSAGKQGRGEGSPAEREDTLRLFEEFLKWKIRRRGQDKRERAEDFQ